MSRPPESDERLVSARLLLELVNNTLDEGYAAAARRRRPDQGRRWYEPVAVIVGCTLIGFVLIVAYVHAHRSEPEVTKAHERLVARVGEAQQDTARLAERADELERRLSAEQDKVLPHAPGLSHAELVAGQTAVAGPGLTVTLSEPPAPTTEPTSGRGGTVPIGATNILTDRDVRSVVNELWAAGAEAISVNDVRLTPTSAIRFAGQAVLVDFDPISSPYRIRAIGPPDRLATAFASSAVASRYQTLSGVRHIGFSFSESDTLELPAAALTKPRYATVVRK